VLWQPIAISPNSPQRGAIQRRESLARLINIAVSPLSSFRNVPIRAIDSSPDRFAASIDRLGSTGAILPRDD
jgi:hypothetical protein